MKRTSILRKFLAGLFALAVVFTVSVREVHYLFAHHDAHEHCENHLHAEDDHAHCAACKFDVSLFTDVVVSPEVNGPQFYNEAVTNSYQSHILYTVVSSNALRGPPAKA